MSLLAISGAFIITLSLLAYGIGSISIIYYKTVGFIVLSSMSVGVVLDVAAITLMAISANKLSFSLHSLIGIVALLVMVVNLVWCWFEVIKKGNYCDADKNHVLYAKLAYVFWVLAYLTGSIIVIWI